MNLKTTVCGFLAVLFLISCDDETSSLGGSLTPDSDIITVTSDSCFASSRTILASDSLLIMTSQCNLGRYTEQNSATTFEAAYITQLSCMENFSIADSVYGIGNHIFPAWFDSAVAGQKPYYANLKLYYTSFFGDSSNTIKIDVFPLDVMVDPNTRYYPNFDPALFCNTSAQPLASTTVSAINYQDTDSLRNLSKYYPSVTIPLPDSIAQMILEAYFNPDTKHYFADSQSFMENLIKGFYIRCSQGDGTILYIDRSVLEVNFKYINYEGSEPKMESLMAEFPGNSEVLQLNSFKWTGLENDLSDSAYTWIRSPFGVLTEITLPIDEMRDNEYVLNSALLRLSTAVTPSSRFKPSVPPTLLMIRKDITQDFFRKNSTPDKVESFVATYSSKYGTYSFENIAAMVEKMYSDRTDWIAENNGTPAAYESARPDWNKVLLIPVTSTLDSKRTAISYRLDIRMHQVKLVGGDTPIKIKTIRTKF